MCACSLGSCCYSRLTTLRPGFVHDSDHLDDEPPRHLTGPHVPLGGNACFSRGMILGPPRSLCPCHASFISALGPSSSSPFPVSTCTFCYSWATRLSPAFIDRDSPRTTDRLAVRRTPARLATERAVTLIFLFVLPIPAAALPSPLHLVDIRRVCRGEGVSVTAVCVGQDTLLQCSLGTSCGSMTPRQWCWSP